jgi:hypothetical protein
VEKHPSSTSSSKPAGRRRVTPWVLVGVLVILIGLEIGIFRQRWFWAAEPRSDVGIYYALEDMARSSKIRPKILIFGDSRMRSGVDAFLLEQELGLKRGEVVNLALTAGTPWDVKLFLARNPWLLDSARLILYQPSDWQFNEYFPPINRVKRFATLQDRARYKDFGTASELVTDYFLQTAAAKEVFKGQVNSLGSRLIKTLLGKYKKAPDLVDVRTGRIRWRVNEAETGPDSVDIEKDITSFYKDFQYSARVEDDLKKTIEQAQGKGIRFVFVDIPVRDIYVSEAVSKYPRHYNEYNQKIHALSRRYNIVFLGDSDTKAMAGIAENYFYDYGHLALKGERAFTLWLAKAIRSDSLY